MKLSTVGISQDSNYFYIPTTPALTPLGAAVNLLKLLLEELSGEIGTETGENLDIFFDNSSFYPEMRLFVWRGFVTKGIFLNFQVVFVWRRSETN